MISTIERPTEPHKLNSFMLDFETFYDDIVSLKTMDPTAYCEHEKFDPYLVSVVGWDQKGNWVEFVGKPAEFDWSIFDEETELWAHNMAFDGVVLQAAERLGIIPEVKCKRLLCSANLSVYCGGPRSLAQAAKVWLGIEMPKVVRSYMKGKGYEEAEADGKLEALLKYGLDDSIIAYRLVEKLEHLWPENEKLLSILTMEGGIKGVCIDQKLVEEAIEKLNAVLDEALKEIPWADTHDDTPLSPKQLKRYCFEAGIPAPTSMAKSNDEFEKWVDRYGDEHPVAQAMGKYRSANAMLKKVLVLKNRTREDGRMGFGLLYWGAHTGRWSGTTGMNMQNVYSSEKFGVQFRPMLKAAPGHKFVIADLSQIEPRCLSYLVQDWDFLDMVKTQSPYEAHARLTMGFKGENMKLDDPKGYKLAKARVLALGYGSGWEKFLTMATMYGAGDVFNEKVGVRDVNRFLKWVRNCRQDHKLEGLTPEEVNRFARSWLIVQDYRKNNPKITGLWESLSESLEESIGGDLEVELPSGRSMKYRNIRRQGGELTCFDSIGGNRKRVYGGLVTENLTQALARDVFAECVLRLHRAGYDPLWTVHDEVIIEVPEAEAEECLRVAEEAMSTPVDWAPEIPLAAEGSIEDHYTK